MWFGGRILKNIPGSLPFPRVGVVLPVGAGFVLEDRIVIDVPADESGGRSGEQPPICAAPRDVVDVTVVGIEPEQVLRVDAVVGGQRWVPDVPEGNVAVAGAT